MSSDEAMRSLAPRRVADGCGFQLDLFLYIVINAAVERELERMRTSRDHSSGARDDA